MVIGVRGQLPLRRSGHTTAVTIGAEQFCFTANQRDDGSLGEVFIHWGTHGTSAAGLVSSYAIALSLGLEHQVPLADGHREVPDDDAAARTPAGGPELLRDRARLVAVPWHGP